MALALRRCASPKNTLRGDLRTCSILSVNQSPTLIADFALEYTFKRSLGPVLGRFFAGLKERQLWGARTKGGRVLMPPSEYDPANGEAIEGLVPLSPRGMVTSYTWVAEPLPQHPLQRPFAFALIRLDGADTAFLHIVDAGSEEKLQTGARVVARWAEERCGSIRDLAWFVVEGEQDQASEQQHASGHERVPEPLELFKSPVRLDYKVIAPETLAKFLRGLQEGKIWGRNDPASGRVYCPPRAGSPTHGTDMGEYVEVSDHGTLTTFCVVNIAFEGQVMKVPYVYGAILLDGSDTPFLHLVDVPPDEARMGLRLKARWKPASERTATYADIACFVASGEPDAAFDRYKEYL